MEQSGVHKQIYANIDNEFWLKEQRHFNTEKSFLALREGMACRQSETAKVWMQAQETETLEESQALQAPGRGTLVANMGSGDGSGDSRGLAWAAGTRMEISRAGLKRRDRKTRPVVVRDGDTGPRYGGLET